ncbi:unnamed protein product [Phytophthora fragariaefolia]|uniref:Unnamed protein product n=1 Tax=Phytophthora fragariaefolia TaxID=1490495 RepID=A0A9W7D203_9STRA|nr:unnamed protein product [Phytophthora fragariaefolia]
MTVLIDSEASFNFATKAGVAGNNALYASALEASKSNTNFDDINSVEPFIVLDMDDRYDLILGMPWLAKHEPWIDWRSRTIGASHNPLADSALVGHVPSSSRDGFVHEHCVPRADRQFAGSSEVLQLPTASPPRARELEVGDGKEPPDPRTPPVGRQGSAVCNRVASGQGTVTTQGADAATARAGRGGSVRAPPMQSVAAGSAHVEECAGGVARANKSGRAGAPTGKAIKGDKVTSTPKAEASGRDADPAAEDRAPQVLDVFTGEPKVGELLNPLPTVAELLELEELSYVEFLDSLKAGELAEVVLLRPEDGSLELNSFSVMDSEVLEDERTARRQTRYGAAILKDPSDPYHPLLKEFSDVVCDDPPSGLPPDRGVRHEIDLVPGTKYCTTRQWPLPKEQVDVIDAFFATKHAAGMMRKSKSPHSSPMFCVRKPNGEWRMVHAFNKLNAATIPVSTSIPRKDVLQNNMAGCTVFSALDMVDGYCQLLMRESDIPLTVATDESLKKDAVWSWTSEAQQAFKAIKSRPYSAPILALPDEDRPFSVLCDASDFAIGCSLFPVTPIEGGGKELPCPRQRTVGDEVRLVQVSGAPVRSKTLCDLHRSCLFEDGDVVASFLSAHGAVASFFAEYNVTVEYKPGEQNVLADALSRRPDYELAHLAYLESPLCELIREVYAGDDDLAGLVEALSVPNKTVELTTRQRSRLHRYSVVEGLLYYQVDGGDEPGIVVPNDEDLRHRVHYEAHDTPLSGHLGREKTYTSVARNFWWPHMYKWVRKYVQKCETCQRVKPAPSASAPLMSLAVPADCWRSVSMDFIFEPPSDARGHTCILVFVCRLSIIVRLAAVQKSMTSPQAAQHFVDNVFRHHALPEAFVSDRDPRFVSHFWQHLSRLLGTRLGMSTAGHRQTDDQTERVNRVLEDILRSVCAAVPTKWSTLLPQVEFALNNAVNSSTGFTPFYVNGLRHPRTPLTLPPALTLGEEEANAEDPRGLKGLRTSVKRNQLSFVETGEAVRQLVRDAMAAAQDTQKEQSDREGRKNTQVFQLGDQVLLNAKNLPTQAVSAVGSTKLRPRFVGPFTVIGSTAMPHFPLLLWAPHGELPPDDGYVRLNSAKYSDWQVLAYEAAMDKDLLKREQQLYADWLARQPPAPERRHMSSWNELPLPQLGQQATGWKLQ